MTGLEYMRTVCPTTKVGKDPLREDVVDAFEDGIAEGWKQYKKKQWKPSDEQMKSLRWVIEYGNTTQTVPLKGIYQQLKKLREGKL